MTALIQYSGRFSSSFIYLKSSNISISPSSHFNIPILIAEYIFTLFTGFLIFVFDEQAIGLRMARENESEQRTRQQRALQAIINEKRAELDR